MAPTPLIFAGKVTDDISGLAIEGARVFIYNKNLDETKSSNDEKFTELLTNSNGEYQCNLGNFDGSWSDGDVIWYSAWYEDKAWVGKTTLTGAPVSDRDLTLRNLELTIALSKLLQMKLDDPNEDNRETNEKWIVPKYSRKDLEKDNYPIIGIIDKDEPGEVAGMTSNQAEERISTCLITLYLWAKSGDSQKFTINSGSYEGTKLRDYLARKISNVLKNEFYLRPSYKVNAIVQKFYDYSKIRFESIDFNSEDDHGIMKKEIEINLTTIDQS